MSNMNNNASSNTNSGSNSSSNRLNVPEARQAMDQFKMQAANEVDNLKNGYNGDLTSREAGDLGKAQMVKKMCPAGRAKYERQSRTAVGHCQRVEYIASMTV